MATDTAAISPEHVSLDSDVIFRAEFASPHVFRQILEYLNPTVNNLPIYFSAKEISMMCVNGSKTLFFNGVIETHNLTEYYLSPEITKGGPDAVHTIHVDVGKLLKSVKELPRRAAFQISQHFGDPDNIALTAIDAHPIASFVRLLQTHPESIDFQEENAPPSDSPNKTILLSKFAHIASSSGKSSSRSSYIRCYPQGVDIVGTSSDKGSSTHVSWGVCNEIDRICELKISVEVMKSMAKLSNLCTEGIVRVYCNDPTYIRLEIPISVLGTAFIYFVESSISAKK